MRFFWKLPQETSSKNSIQKTRFKKQPEIIEAIGKLAEDPVPHDAKRIYGTGEKLFRIRVGDFRVLYRIDYGEVIIIVVNIDSRKRVYRDI